jgi:hypothetical protein
VAHISTSPVIRPGQSLRSAAGRSEGHGTAFGSVVGPTRGSTPQVARVEAMPDGARESGPFSNPNPAGHPTPDPSAVVGGNSHTEGASPAGLGPDAPDWMADFPTITPDPRFQESQ